MQAQGRLAAVGSSEGGVVVFDIGSGHIEWRAKLHSGAVTRIAFTPDGKLILSGSDDKSVRVWSADDGQPVGDAWLHPGAVRGIAVSSDGQMALTSASGGNVVRQWSVQQGKLLAEPFTSPGVAQDLATVDEGRSIALAHDYVGRVWQVEQQAFSDVRMPHLGMIRDIDATLEGELIGTGSDDHAVRIWKWPSGTQWGGQLDHHDIVNCLGFQPGKRRLVTASSGIRHEVRCWRLAASDLLAHTMPGIQQYAFFFASHDRQLFAPGVDSRVHSFQMHSGKPHGAIDGSSDVFAVSRDGKQLVCATKTGIIVSDLVRQEPIFRVETDGSSFERMMFSPSGRLVLGFAYDGVTMVDCSSQRVMARLIGHTGYIFGVDFTSDDRLIATGSLDRTVRFWDGRTGEPLGSPLLHPDVVSDIRFWPGEKTLVAASRNGEFWFWDVETRQQTRAPVRLPAPFKVMRFHPSAPWALAIAGNGTAQFFDVLTGQPVGKLMLHYSNTMTLCFTPDGQIAVTTGPDNQACYWRVPQERRGTVADIKRQIEFLTGLALGPDEKVVYLTAAEWKERRTN